MSDYADDSSIPDDAELWRRIRLDAISVKNQDGREIPSSAAFDDSSDGTPMSVALATVLLSPGRLIEGQRCPCGVASFMAGQARALGLRICRDDSGASYPGHAYVAGEKTRRARRALAKSCTWVISPEQARGGLPPVK